MLYEELNFQKNGKPCIYSIKNKINNKVYIGSAIGHYSRKGQHYYMLRRNIHFNKHLQSSWNKYGEENFKFTVIEFITDLESINKKEEYYIEKYNATNPSIGYNHRKECGRNFGNKWSDEAKKRFSDLKKGKPILHLDYKKLAEQHKKKVVAIKDNNYIIFNSIKEAGICTKTDKTSISKVLHKQGKTANKYKWEFYSDFTKKLVSNNSVNSGNILRDNPDPRSENSMQVSDKEQRLTGEELTNKPDTSAEQPKYAYDAYCKHILESKNSIILPPKIMQVDDIV